MARTFWQPGALWTQVGPKARRCRCHSPQASRERTRSFPRGNLCQGRPIRFRRHGRHKKAIVSYRVGKRDTENTDLFIRDLRERVIEQPETSTGFLPYLPAIRDAFGKDAVHGQIIKTYSVVDLRPQAAARYSPCEVIAVERDVVSGVPTQISTSYVERSNLSLRMASRRFTRLTQRVFKEARQPPRGRVAVRRAFQPVPRSRNPADHASHRHRRC